MERNLNRWLIIVFIVILVSGFFIVLWAAQSEDSSLRNQLLIKTSLAETGIGTGQVLALTGSKADLTSPDYLQLKGQMAKIRSTDPLIRFVYLMGERSDGTVFLFLDSEDPTSEDYSPPGDVYAEASSLLQNTFTSGEMATEGPLDDRWGKWVTGFVPLKDPETGRVIAVLGMDVDARNWNWQIATACAPAVVGLLLIQGLLLAFFFVQERNERDKQVQKKSENAIREHETQLRATLESTADGILAVDNTGKVLQASRRFAELWKIPPALMEQGDDRALLDFVLDQLTDPDAFLRKVQVLYGSDAVDMDTLAFKDGRVFERYSSPMILDGARIGRVWSFRDITDRKRAEEALHISEEKFRKAFFTSPDSICITRVNDGMFVSINKGFTEISGYTEDDILGKTSLEINIWKDPEDRRRITQALQAKGEVRNYEARFLTKSGEIYGSMSASIIELNGVPHILNITHDMTKRKLAEEQLKHFNEELERGIADRTEKLNASLEEKVVLLREIHHRVKNNLQIIISLLNLQSRYIEDEKTSQAIKESQNRIRAMALVHEKLYLSADIAKIDLDNYIRFLGKSLFQFYDMKGTGVILTTDIPDIPLDINTAIPVGLIINELVSNSLKHAFPDGRKGEISIAINREDHTLTLIYKDDGVGIPHDLDWRNAKSLGLRLVISLVEQLQGTVELDRTGGTVFTIVVKEKE